MIHALAKVGINLSCAVVVVKPLTIGTCTNRNANFWFYYAHSSHMPQCS